MKLQQLRARVKRLQELSTGLTREDLWWRKDPGALMHSERALYLNAIFKARQAMEEARSTLAKICQRLEVED
jgi:hypothetical protein